MIVVVVLALLSLSMDQHLYMHDIQIYSPFIHPVRYLCNAQFSMSVML